MSPRSSSLSTPGLFRIKTELNRRGVRPEQVNKTGMSEVQFVHHTKLQRMHLTEKNSRIEHSLIRFEEEFFKQKQQVKLLKEIEEKKYQEIVKQNREVCLSNLRTNHNYMKGWEKQLTTLWKGTRATMQELKDVTLRFNTNMTDKIRREEEQRL